MGLLLNIYLIGNGANINITDSNGDTPLIIVCRKKNDGYCFVFN